MSLVPTHWFWEQKLAPDFCEHILATYFNDAHKEVATVSGKPEDQATRKTNVCWIPPLEPISLLILNHALIANYKAGWNVDVEFIEPVQLGEYADGGHYDWHTDTGVAIGPEDTRKRKLSVVVMLTAPDQYEGGDLILGGDTGVVAPKTQGTICVFPSPLLHTVTPVTKGKRYTLVGWCCGPTWK